MSRWGTTKYHRGMVTRSLETDKPPRDQDVVSAWMNIFTSSKTLDPLNLDVLKERYKNDKELSDYLCFWASSSRRRTSLDTKWSLDGKIQFSDGWYDHLLPLAEALSSNSNAMTVVMPLLARDPTEFLRKPMTEIMEEIQALGPPDLIEKNPKWGMIRDIYHSVLGLDFHGMNEIIARRQEMEKAEEEKEVVLKILALSLEAAAESKNSQAYTGIKNLWKSYLKNEVKIPDQDFKSLHASLKSLNRLCDPESKKSLALAYIDLCRMTSKSTHPLDEWLGEDIAETARNEWVPDSDPRTWSSEDPTDSTPISPYEQRLLRSLCVSVSLGSMSMEQAISTWEKILRNEWVNPLDIVLGSWDPSIHKPEKCVEAWIVITSLAPIRRDYGTKLYDWLNAESIRQGMSLAAKSIGGYVAKMADTLKTDTPENVPDTVIEPLKKKVSGAPIEFVDGGEPVITLSANGFKDEIPDLAHRVIMGLMTVEQAAELWGNYVNSDGLDWNMNPEGDTYDNSLEMIEVELSIMVHAKACILAGSWWGTDQRSALELFKKNVEAGKYPRVSLVEGKFKIEDKTPGLVETAVNVLADDTREIALRTGVKRIRQFLTDRIIAFWTRRNPQKTEEDKAAYQEKMSGFLGSETGQGILSYLLGFSWDMVSDQIEDQEVRSYGDSVAKECRVSGGTMVLDEIITDIVSPMVSSVQEAMDPLRMNGLRIDLDPATSMPEELVEVPVTLESRA